MRGERNKRPERDLGRRSNKKVRKFAKGQDYEWDPSMGQGRTKQVGS